MENKEFYIDKDGFKLHAKLDFPKEAPEKLPLMVVVPGLTGHMEERHIIGAVDAALEAGVACLRVELYGHGKSDGNFCNHNLFEWLSELLFILDYARDLPFVTKLYLAGHSQGGLAVILAAGMKGDVLDGLLPLSPATIIVQSCSTGNFFGKQVDPVNLPRKIELWPDRDETHDHFTDNYVRIGRLLPVNDMIDAYKGPVLLVHGDEDEAVPYQCGVDAANRYQNCKFVTVHGDDHCFDYHLDEMKTAITEFLKEQVG